MAGEALVGAPAIVQGVPVAAPSAPYAPALAGAAAASGPVDPRGSISPDGYTVLAALRAMTVTLEFSYKDKCKTCELSETYAMHAMDPETGAHEG